MDFLAIDFETPNSKNDSICGMGITFVRNSVIEFCDYVLIDPEARFDQRNVAIHGIHEKDIKGAPTFRTVWEQYNKYFRHYPIVMHNADFDSSVLYKVASAYGIVLPDMDFYCTKCLCSENIVLDSYSLPNLCKYFSFELDHHNCASDSKATAQIMLKLLENEEFSIHISIPSTTFFERRDAWKRKNKPATKEHCVAEISNEREFFHLPSYSTSNADNLVLPDCVYSDEELLFENRRYVFTGMLPNLDRSKAAAFVERLGGQVSSSVSKKTDYLIVGTEDLSVVGTDGKSSKIEKAEVLISKGANIRLVAAERFVERYILQKEDSE